MGQLKQATEVVFQQSDRMAEGDQTLLAAMTAFNDIRKTVPTGTDSDHFARELDKKRSVKFEGRQKIALIIYNTLCQRVIEVNAPEFDAKFERFKDFYAPEIKALLSSSDTNHHQALRFANGQRGHGRT